MERKRMVAWVALTAAMLVVGASAKVKKGAAPADGATPVWERLPQDLSQASLRVHAVDAAYELDLSVAQMREIVAVAGDTADPAQRAGGNGAVKLANVMQKFNNALLDGKDDDAIAQLRNQLAEMEGDDAVQLDTDVHPTAASRQAAAGVVKSLKAGQIAAYLASHADQVSDPAELLVSALEAIREAKADGGGAGGDGQNEADVLMKEEPAEVGYLVAGDDAAAGQIARQAAAWLEDHENLSDAEIAQQGAALETSAQQVVGDVGPMTVLDHWMDEQIATLLANPQLKGALGEMIRAKQEAVAAGAAGN